MTVESSPRFTGSSRAILVLLLVALVIRLAWGLSRPADDASLGALPDQNEYLQIGRSVLHGNGFIFLDSRFNSSVRAFRTPGYPLLVAGCGGNVRAIRTVQALLDTSTVLAIFLLASCFMLGRIGPLIGAAFVAFNPYLIYFAGLVLSETLFTAMLAWAMLLLARGRQRQSPRQWILGGFLLSLGILVRPSVVALPVLLGLLSVFLNRTTLPAYQRSVRAQPAWRLPPGLVMLFLTIISLLPWVIRNRVVLGRWIWLDTNSGFTLYDGYNPNATGGSDQTFINRLPELQRLGEVERDTYLSGEAAAYARAHPRRVLELIGAKLIRTWSPVPLSQEYGKPALRAIALAYSIPFDALVLFGLFRCRLGRAVKLFLMAPAVYFTVVHALTVGSLRYRIPAEPPLAVLIAALAAGGAMPWRRLQMD